MTTDAARNRATGIGYQGGVPDQSKDVRVGDAVAPAAARPRGWRRLFHRSSLARRHLSKGVRLILFLFILNNLVLPQIGGARNAVRHLSEVNPFMLVLGMLFEFGSLTCFAMLTRSALPRHSVQVHEQIRIQLATKAVTNTVPGGNAAGSALGYRLLTAAGVRGADAGFALATAGIGSAVVLNLILWAGLLVSIPLRGFNAAYVSAALVGVLLMGFFAFLVFGLMKGSAAAERFVRAIGRRLRFVDEEKLAALVRRLAQRLDTLLSDPAILGRAAGWAALHWLSSATALWIFLRAFGVTAEFDALIVSFGLANVLAAIPITPGGLGIIEATLLSTLAGFGQGSRTAIAIGIAAYRIAQFWLPIPVGALAYLSLRLGPFSLRRRARLGSLRKLAEEALATKEDRLTWAERYGNRPVRPPGTDE